MKTTTINGKLYNVEVATSLCVGCAAIFDHDLCKQLPYCNPRNDLIPGNHIIFVEAKQPEPKPAPQPGDQSQNGRILKHLKQGHSINPMQALRLFNCWSLAQRIHNLKGMGYDIDSMPGYNPRTKKKYAVYFLKETT